MADAFLCGNHGTGGGGSGDITIVGKALLRVYTEEGNYIEVTNASDTYNRVCDANEFVDFRVSHDTWTIKVKNRKNENEKSTFITIDDDSNREITLKPKQGGDIKAISDVGNVVTITKGSTSATKAISADGYITFEELEFGTWTVKIATANEKAFLTQSVNVNAYTAFDVELRPKEGHTYGIKIDTTNGDPKAAVTYTDDAVGFTPLSVNQSSGACTYGSWDATTFMKDFLGCRPCLVKNGAVVGYLNPNDYSKFEDGTAADITSGNAGDVMIEFKKCWYKFSKTGTNIFFQVSDVDRSKDGFVTTAFKSMKDGSAVDKIYYGAYEGYNLSNKWRSISGKTCTGNVSYTQTRTYCKANGDKYGMEDYAKRWYVMGLMMLVTKNRDMQTAIGQGRWNNQSSALQTGTMNTKGLFYGKSVYTDGVKCFGIENMWANLYNWVDGIITLSGTTLGFKDAAPYNDTGSGYKSVTDGHPRNNWSYGITDMIPVLDGAAMTAITGNSDGTKGWADGWCVNSNSTRVPWVGGYFSYNSNSAPYVGPFAFLINNNPSNDSDVIVGRVVAA